MKRKMTFSLTLTLSLLLSLVSLPSTAQAAPPQRFGADSGVVIPSATQTLRVTVAGTGGNDVSVRIRWMQYAAQGCSGMPPVCRHMVVNQGTTPTETLGPGDALSVDVPGGSPVRMLVLSNRHVEVVIELLNEQGSVVVAFRPADLDNSTIGE